MQHEAMSRFAPSTAQECTTVLDCAGAEARQEIAHDALPSLQTYARVGDSIEYIAEQYARQCQNSGEGKKCHLQRIIAL